MYTEKQNQNEETYSKTLNIKQQERQRDWNNIWNLQDLIKKEVKFPGGNQAKTIWNFQGYWFLALDFSRG